MTSMQTIITDKAGKVKGLISPEWVTVADVSSLTGYRGGAVHRLVARLRAAGVRTFGKGIGLRINLADVREKLNEMANQ